MTATMSWELDREHEEFRASLTADGAPAAPAEGAEAVRAAVAASRRGNDASRWPGKLPVADRLTVLLDPGSWREDGLLANAAAGGLPAPQGDASAMEDLAGLQAVQQAVAAEAAPSA